VIAVALPSPFLLQVAAGIVCALLLFMAPGVVALRGRRLLFAPAIGVCLFGPVALVLCFVLGLSWPIVVLAWAVSLVGAWWWGRSGDEPAAAPHGRRVLLLAGLLASFLVLDLLPWEADGRTYYMTELYDHDKVAMIDSMVREGMPPRNPYLSPGGEAIPLAYYHGTHALAACVCELTGVAGWPGSVSMTWYAAFAFVTLCAGWAVRWGGAGAGKWAVLACLLGTLTRPLHGPFGPIGPTSIDFSNDMFGLGTFAEQANWAPHHILATVGLVTALWALVRYAEDGLDFRRATVLIAGGFAICAASSTWVAFTAVLAAPCVLLATRGRGWRPALAGAALAVVLAWPVLAAIVGRPNEVPLGRSPIGWRVLDVSGLSGWALDIPLYWVYFLPLRLGVCYVAGLLAMWTGRKRPDVRVALFAVLAALLMAQFVRSQIGNNDLGWRGLLPAILLLNARAAAWRCGARMGFVRAAWAVGVVLGLVAVLATQSFVTRPWNDPARTAVATAFTHQAAAWEAVRRHTQPHELVVSNFNAYNAMVWLHGSNLNWALLSNRPSAMSGGELPHLTTFRRDPAARQRARWLVDSLFYGSDQAEHAARELRDKFKVKALMLDRLDRAWPGHAIDRSGAWRLVESSEHWKVYVAVKP
jgi:hypothetical protein